MDRLTNLVRRSPPKRCKFCQVVIHSSTSHKDVCENPRCIALLNKSYPNWTEEDLLYVKEKNPEEWYVIKREIDKIEDERAAKEFELMQIKEREKLEHQREENEKRLMEQRRNMLSTHEAHMREMNLEKEKKILAVKESLDCSRKQHSKAIDEMEREHQARQLEKEKELAYLRAEQEKTESRFEKRYGEQHRLLSERATEMDSKYHQAWGDLDRRMKERSSALEAKLAESQAKFEKKLELTRNVMKQEAEEAFTSRITTQLEVEKADGSRLRLSETTPGLVSQMATNLGIFPDSDSNELFKPQSS